VTKPQTLNADLAHLPTALDPLTTELRWVVWLWELRTTKGESETWTKPPRQPCDPTRNARANDPSTWGSYEDAVAAVAAGKADGIGYMLMGSNVAAIDLDHCVDRASGKLDPWAEQLHNEAAGAYQEITVSATGLRMIGTGDGPEVHRKFTFDRETGAAIELYRNTPRYITVSGVELGSCTGLPPLDPLIDRLLARHGAAPPDGLDFNDAGRRRDYDDLIRNGAPEGDRSEPFQATVWHLAGRGRTIDQIVDELARLPNGIGAKYADRLHAEVSRSYDKWRARKRAAATGESSTTGAPWPQIFVAPGELPRVVDEAESALLTLGQEIYQRGGLIVRPVLSKLKASDDRDTTGWRLVAVTRPYLIEALTCAARFLKFDARSKSWVATDAPDRVAEAYLARQGAWKLPVLRGIVNAPFLRADGSICETPGYDPVSGLLYKPEGRHFPPIPREPTWDDASKALASIDELIAGFPFVTPADRSVALSGILTLLDRRSMATAPLHAFTAPSAGTGKSLLVDIAAMLATGQPMPVIAQGRSEEELDKRLGASLLAGDLGISLDNCDHALQGAFLCQALTQQRLAIRLLGQSRNVETPCNAVLYATGNNLPIAGDLTRRTLLCSLDAGVEHPERRTFNNDPLAIARAERRRLVVAALTVLRAWHVAGQRLGHPPFGSFEEWSHRIRGPLVWLGRTDPCETVAKVRANDPAREALATVIALWADNLTVGTQYTVQEIINRATKLLRTWKRC
jgi:hypothetical protein